MMQLLTTALVKKSLSVEVIKHGTNGWMDDNLHKNVLNKSMEEKIRGNFWGIQK